MKTFVPFIKLVCVIALAVSFLPVNAQSGGESELLTNGLKFKNPILQTASSTDLNVGAIYLFEDVATGVDARLRIDSLINGARVRKIDDNSNGLGYKDALQPEIRSGNVIGRSYAVFTITFYKANTTTIETLQTVNATSLDIDGNLLLKEFAELRMGNGAIANVMGGLNLDIAILNLLLGKFRADNLLGIERDGIDTTSYSNMFTARNNGISSFSLRYGTTTLLPSTDERQFSMYMKGFSYPN